MKYQPPEGTKTNDVVFTSRPLAKRIIDHFKPKGRVLDPARGDGAFYDQIEGEKDWCEISQGRDFFDYRARADSIITNPPWSLFRQFLVHSMELANDIYFLVSIDLVFTKDCIRDVRNGGFGIKEIYLVDAPSNFPQSGFQIGVVHFKKGFTCDVHISEDIEIKQEQFSFL